MNTTLKMKTVSNLEKKNDPKNKDNLKKDDN